MWFILWYWGYATHRKLSEGWGELLKSIYKYDTVIPIPRGFYPVHPCMPCSVLSYILPCPARPCHVLTCPALPACRVLSCSSLSCAALTWPALYYPTMSFTEILYLPCMLPPTFLFRSFRWLFCYELGAVSYITPLPCWPFVAKLGRFCPNSGKFFPDFATA